MPVHAVASKSDPSLRFRGGSSADRRSSWLSSGDPAAAHCYVLRGPTPGRPCSRPRSGPTALGRPALRPHRVTPTPATATRPPSSRHIRHIQHADLGITSASLRGIDDTEIIHAVHEQPAPDDSRSPAPRRHSLLATDGGAGTDSPRLRHRRPWGPTARPNRHDRNPVRRRIREMR